MTSPLVSIGTRAYNAETTIEQTIKSVLNQSERNLEYWIVDNGSTDSTFDIIQSYARSDDRVKCLRLESNDPLFSTLEMLVENARGEFLTLLDSDDWFETNFIDDLYQNAKLSQAQIAVGGSFFHFVDEDKIGERKNDNSGVLKIEQVPTVLPAIYRFFRTVWGKIYSAELVRRSWNVMQSKRPDWLSYGGDTYTCFELLNNASNIYISSNLLHNYRVYSSSSSYHFSKERFDSDIFLLEHALKFLNQFGNPSMQNLDFIYRVFWHAILDTTDVLIKSDLSPVEKVSYMEEIYKNKHVELMKKII